MRPLSSREIEEASSYGISTGVVKQTDLERYDEFYQDIDLYFKREDTQTVGSFKIRGAFNAMSLLSDDEKMNGVVCASAGNHAQGFAIACTHFKIQGTVFMPVKAPDVKVEATRKFGGEYVDIQLIGDNFDETKVASEKFTQENNAKFIHPFDDSGVIIGTSTIGYEIFEQMREIGKEVDYILVPVGGGGLIAGIIEARNLYSPNTQVIGVEPAGHRSMKESLKAGRVITLDNPVSTRFADGAAVARVGDMTFDITLRNKTHVIDVKRDRLAKYLGILQDKSDIVLEPSGALSVAAIGHEIDRFKGKTVVCILSGANIDQSRVDRIPELSRNHDDERKGRGKFPIQH